LVTPLPSISTPATTPAQSGLLTTPTPTITTFEGESRRALQFIISHPGQVGRYIVTHYLNSQMQSLLILPSTLRIFDSTTAFIGHRSLGGFGTAAVRRSNISAACLTGSSGMAVFQPRQ
jgi:hypothetical protein